MWVTLCFGWYLCSLVCYWKFSFLGALAKLRKATVSFIMSVRPSVRLHGTTELPLDGFLWNSIYQNCSKICREYTSFIKMWQEERVLYVKIYVYLWLSRQSAGIFGKKNDPKAVRLPPSSFVKFLGALAKLRKATTIFAVSVSVRMEQLYSHWTDFDETWYLSFFRKSVDKIQVSLKSDMNNEVF